MRFASCGKVDPLEMIFHLKVRDAPAARATIQSPAGLAIHDMPPIRGAPLPHKSRGMCGRRRGSTTEPWCRNASGRSSEQHTDGSRDTSASTAHKRVDYEFSRPTASSMLAATIPPTVRSGSTGARRLVRPIQRSTKLYLPERCRERLVGRAQSEAPKLTRRSRAKALHATKHSTGRQNWR